VEAAVAPEEAELDPETPDALPVVNNGLE